MIKRLIFDIDGTLITGVSFDKAIKNTLAKYDLFSEENKQKFISAIPQYEIKYLSYKKNAYLQHFSQTLGCMLDEDFLETFFYNLGQYAIPNDNEQLIQTIDQLSKKYEILLLSNYFEKSQRNRLESIGINKYFSEYYGEEICKPKREAYISAIGIHKPEECVMIGDNLELDINGAKKCGINTIWLNSKRLMQYQVRTISVDNVNRINERLIRSFEVDLER